MNRQRTKMVSDINIVPYIDVMLVLLVIFMATAPLLTQGVKVDLPEVNALPISQEELDDPLIITVSIDGTYSVNLGGDTNDKVISRDALSRYISKIIRTRADTPIFVRGDTKVAYGYVLDILALAQAAGAAYVNLITVPPSVDV